MTTTTQNALNNTFDGSKLTGAIPAGVIPATAVTPGAYTNSSVTVGADGRVTAASSGSVVLPTTVVSGTTQAAAVNNRYVPNNAGVCTVTLPSTAAVGDTISILGLGAGGWSLAQNASQLVHFGSVASTTGTGGSIASSNQYDSITIVCVVANTTWCVVASQGNLSVT